MAAFSHKLTVTPGSVQAGAGEPNTTLIEGNGASSQTAAAQPGATPAKPAATPAKKKAIVGLTRTQLSQIRLARVPSTEWSEWYDAPRIEASDKTLTNELNVAMARNTAAVFKDGKIVPQQVNLRSYNGGLVGPTYVVEPGDTINLTLNNRLDWGSDPEHCRTGSHDVDMNNPANFCLNTTNLHTHGLHISPTGEPGAWSDNVLLSIKPQTTEKYKLQILPAGNPEPEKPIDHYPGTFWYHAHQHGSTATQLASGMAGALIIKGDIDNFPGIKGATDRIFVMQQLAFDAQGEVKPRDNNIISTMRNNWAGNNPAVTGPPKVVTINGRLLPKITMHPGEVERWRFIDAGIFQMLDMWLQQRDNGAVIPFHQIAIDGITLKHVRRLTDTKLGPGYRMDLMVKMPDSAKKGTIFELYTANSVYTADPDKPGAKPGTAPAQLVAIVEIEGDPCSKVPDCHSTIPAAGSPLPAPRSLPDITAREVLPKPKKVLFGSTKGFIIDDVPYKHDLILPQFELTKGTAEQWEVHNGTTVAHPFHIHVNAFQLVNPDGTPGDWHDTIIVPPGKTITFRTRYERFTGEFVLHCHILTHEDTGMMQNVKIKDK